MIIAASTVIRHSPPDACSGRVLLLEMGNRPRCVDDIRVPESKYRSVDPNPRGGTRGLRTVSQLNEYLVVANYATVFLLDTSGHVVTTVEHPYMAMIHAVVPDDQGFWVVSSNADAILRLDWSGALVHAWQPSQSEFFHRHLHPPRPLDWNDVRNVQDPRLLSGRLHDVLHLNGLQVRDDRMLISVGQALSSAPTTEAPMESDPASLGTYREDVSHLLHGQWHTQHAIVAYDMTDGEPVEESCRFLWQDSAQHMPHHDLLERNGTVWFCDSSCSDVVGVDNGLDTHRIPIPGDFLRGLVPLDDTHVLVATQRPLTVHCVNLDTCAVVDSWNIGGYEHESIASLARWEGSWR